MKRKTKEEINKEMKECEIRNLEFVKKQNIKKMVATIVLLALTYISFICCTFRMLIILDVDMACGIFTAAYMVLNTINALINGKVYQITSAMGDGAAETFKDAMKNDNPLQSTKQRVETKVEYGAAAGAAVATWFVWLYYMFFGFISGIRGLIRTIKTIKECKNRLEELQSN